MITRKVHINNWVCNFYFAIERYYIDEILICLKKIGASLNVRSRIRDKMLKDEVNGGFTYSNTSRRESVIVIGKTSNGAEFMNSFTHELRHLVDDIAKADNINTRGENVAYLTGDITKEVSDIVCKLSCNECRRKLYGRY
jgi:hypothetical protein